MVNLKQRPVTLSDNVVQVYKINVTKVCIGDKIRINKIKKKKLFKNTGRLYIIKSTMWNHMYKSTLWHVYRGVFYLISG